MSRSLDGGTSLEPDAHLVDEGVLDSIPSASTQTGTEPNR